MHGSSPSAVVSEAGAIHLRPESLERADPSDDEQHRRATVHIASGPLRVTSLRIAVSVMELPGRRDTQDLRWDSTASIRSALRAVMICRQVRSPRSLGESVQVIDRIQPVTSVSTDMFIPQSSGKSRS